TTVFQGRHSGTPRYYVPAEEDILREWQDQVGQRGKSAGCCALPRRCTDRLLCVGVRHESKRLCGDQIRSMVGASFARSNKEKTALCRNLEKWPIGGDLNVWAQEVGC